MTVIKPVEGGKDDPGKTAVGGDVGDSGGLDFQ